MAKGKIKVTLYLEEEQAKWLAEKARQGYRKSGIVRLLIGECMSSKLTREKPASAKGSGMGSSVADDAERVAVAKPPASADGFGQT